MGRANGSRECAPDDKLRETIIPSHRCASWWVSLPTLRTYEPLPQFPPCRDRQRAHDLLAAHHHDLVHHVDDDAHVVGHDPHDVADPGPGVAAGEVEEAV